MSESLDVCRNCGRPLVRGRVALVHRLEDFDRSKSIDCFKPEPKEAAAEALYRHMESEAAENGAILISPPADEYECCATEALAAADAYDAAHGIHRLVIDSAAVERVSEVLLEGRAVCECKRSPFDKHDVNPPCSTRTWARQTARAVLAAAVEAGEEAPLATGFPPRPKNKRSFA